MALRLDFNFKVPEDDVRKMLLAIEPSTLEKIVYQAGKTARRAAVTRTAKLVSGEFNLSSRQVKAEIKEANREPPKMVAGNAVVRMTMNTQPRSLRQWGFFDNGRGVYGYIERGVKLKWHHSFQMKGEKGKAVGASGQRGLIWTRYEPPHNTLPIGVPMGPAVGNIVLGRGRYSGKFQTEITERASEQWMKGFEQGYRRYFT